MWRRPWTLALALTIPLIGAAPAAAGDSKIEVAYSLMKQTGGGAVATSLLDGLGDGDGFRVRLRPSKECFAYLVAQRSTDDLRLLLPDHRTRRGRNQLAKGQDFTWPQTGWLRLDGDRGVERLYLIVSDRQILELEARHTLRRPSFPESVILEIRDRYQGVSSTRRKVNDERVKVKFKARSGEPALLIEEIAIRHM